MILQILRKVIGLSKIDFPDSEIMSLCGVLFINAHEVPVSATPTVGLYETVSYLEHNCVNNASKHFDMNSTVFIRAAVPIKKGEHISISYSDPMWGTRNRKHHLMETKYFECGCARCIDPSEFGTHFSSIRCHQCSGQQKGYLTPVSTQLLQAATPQGSCTNRMTVRCSASYVQVFCGILD